MWRLGVPRQALQDLGEDVALSIMDTEDGALGRLRMLSSEREIAGASCEQVAAALALVLAMSLSDDEEAQPALEPEGATASRAEATDTRPTAVTGEPQPTTVVAVARAEPGKTARPRAALAAGAFLLTTSGALPNQNLGLGVHLEIVSPSLRSFRVTAQREAVITDGSPGASFELYSSQAQVCPAAWGWRLQLIGCAAAEVGLMRVSGLAAMETQSVSRPWLAVGALARIRYPIGDRLSADLSAGAVLPVQRDRFYFEPDLAIHQVSGVVLRSALSLAMEI
jgi:hypothetical protein